MDWFLYDRDLRHERAKERLMSVLSSDPVDIYLSEVNKGNTRTMFEICSKLIIKTPERRS